MTSGQRPNPWIKHNGSDECPCVGIKVDLQFKDYPELTTDKSEREDWAWLGCEDDIIYWRVAR